MLKKMKMDFVIQFSIDDFKTKYAGSILGLFWAFAQPIITVLIYWFVFQFAFGSEPVNGMPFILWLISGILPWFFISDAIVSATSSLVDYGYLVKKVVFDINILPLTRIISVLFIQIVLFIFMMIMFIGYGYFPNVYWIQLLYYLLYCLFICVGVVYFTSALFVFFKDIVQIVSVILQIIFWGTPIVWQISVMSEKIQKILRYNPLYYIVNGYRDAVINNKWFWQYRLMDIAYYWIVAFVIFIVGIYVFKKLKHHFADVL